MGADRDGNCLGTSSSDPVCAQGKQGAMTGLPSQSVSDQCKGNSVTAGYTGLGQKALPFLFYCSCKVAPLPCFSQLSSLKE